MAVCFDAALRFDDFQESQLGDALHFADVVTLSLFGTKTDRSLAGQSAALPQSTALNSGVDGLVDNARDGLRRLLALDRPVLIALAARFQASSATERQAGPEALATWPDDIRALADQLYAVGLPVHRLPINGRLLVEELTVETDLDATLSSQEFSRLARATLGATGVDTTRVGAHSFRRGRAVEMYHGNAGNDAVSDALRHRDKRSAVPYVLAPARLTALAASMRAAEPHGRSLGRAHGPGTAGLAVGPSRPAPAYRPSGQDLPTAPIPGRGRSARGRGRKLPGD